MGRSGTIFEEVEERRSWKVNVVMSHLVEIEIVFVDLG